MANFRDYTRRLTTLKARRNMLVGAFWILLILLISTIAATYVTDGQTQQSAYGDDWNDLGLFREEINRMGVDTTALVSSPLLLSEIDHPEEAIFIISGVEKDTISLPRFTGDENVIELSEGSGYTTSEILAIDEFVEAGGTVLLMDDKGYSSTLAEQFGLEFSGHTLYDGEAYATELDYNFIWVNTTSAFNFTTNSGSLSSIHPCLRDTDTDGFIDLLDTDPYDVTTFPAGITREDAGLCSHRWISETQWDFSENYNLLTNQPSAFNAGSYNPVENRYDIGKSTLDSYLDTNDDGCLLYTSPSPRDRQKSRMPSSA